MTSKMTPGPLQNFIDHSIDELLSLSDAELHAEVRDDGEDPDKVAAEMRRLTEQVISESGRSRMAAAKAIVAQRRGAVSARRVVTLPLGQKQQIVSRFSAQDQRLSGRLTLAARNGAGASEREIDSVLEDLIDLGIIDEAGNLL